MNIVTVRKTDNILYITGDLTQDTVMSALEQCCKLLVPRTHMDIDFSAITRCDSASVAFLTALLREGKGKEVQLRFSHLPEQMLQISRVSGLENILPLAEP